MSAGDGARFRGFTQKLQPGDKIFAYAKGHGYVGYGIVTAEAVMARGFRIAKPIEKAQARLAEMRAAGLSPGHGGEAAKKRGAKVAESNRKRSLGGSTSGERLAISSQTAQRGVRLR